MKFSGKAVLFFVAVAICICSLPASATIVSFNMNVVFNNGSGTNPVPWVNAIFDDGGSSGAVTLTISAPGLSNQQKVEEVYFNLAPSLNPSQLAFSAPAILAGSLANPVITLDKDRLKADGDGKYDIKISFNNNGPDLAFNGGDSVRYTITLASLTANSFDFLSEPSGGNGPYKTASHLLGVGTGTGAWVTIPEPATMVLLGIGSLALLRRKRA